MRRLWTSFFSICILAKCFKSISLSPKTTKHLQSNLGTELASSIQLVAESAYSSWSAKGTSFLNPLQTSLVVDAYKELTEQYELRLCGGFRHACDNNIIVFSRSDPMKTYDAPEHETPHSNTAVSILSPDESIEFVSGVRVVGTSALELFTHRDLLATLKSDLNLPTGKEIHTFHILYIFHVVANTTTMLLTFHSLNKICIHYPGSYGDIVMEGANKAQLVVSPSVAPALIASLKQVAGISATAVPLPLVELLVKKQSVKEISTVEASLRLDAVSSAGFGLSRSKVMDLIEAGQVSLNWKEVGKPYNVQVSI